MKAIAREDGIDGFPVHLRVLHVRQEVPSHLAHDISVLEAVLSSDLERNMMLDREKELVAKLEKDGETDGNLSFEEKRKKLAENSGIKDMEKDLRELDAIYSRLQMLSADSAEARAAMILSGLQFTPAMQSGPVSALSGGWRMRVALAAALFIEPDILVRVTRLRLQQFRTCLTHFC